MMLDRKQDSALFLHRPIVQCVSNLIGEADHPLLLTGQYMDEATSLKTNNGTVLELIYFCKGFIAVILGLHDGAGTFFSKVEFKHICPLYQSMAAYLSGLACFSRALDTSGFQKLREIRNGRLQLDLVRQSAASNPFFVHKVHLLEAKLALCCSKSGDGHCEFANAIEGAQRYNSRLDEALATEHAGVALLACDKRPNSNGFRYLTNALLLYEQWGAQKKVEKMRTIYGFSNQEEKSLLPEPGGLDPKSNGPIGVTCKS